MPVKAITRAANKVDLNNGATKTVTSITRAANILIAMDAGASKITDISHSTGLNKATVHRMLKTLEASGFVVQDPVKRQYFLGALIVKLASNPGATHQQLVLCSRTELQRLWELTSETVSLQIRVGDRRMFLGEIQSPHNFRFAFGNGATMPLYGGAGGKILLSELSQAELEVILEHIHPVAVTANTITDKEKLRQELLRVKEQGYASSYGELASGGVSLAVPIKNYVCPVALGIGLPTSRLTSEAKIVEELEVSAARISQSLLKSARASEVHD